MVDKREKHMLICADLFTFKILLFMDNRKSSKIFNLLSDNLEVLSYV